MPAIRARLRFLVHPVEQQNREHQNQQTEGNTGCAHTIDPSWRSPEPNGMGGPLFQSGGRIVPKEPEVTEPRISLTFRRIEHK